MNVILDVYGSGDPNKYFTSSMTRIRYRGPLQYENVQPTMANYDVLILPSRHDGWGVVVNEALNQGVPAIVSDTVGAKCLLESTGAGIVFRNGNVQELSDVINTLISSPESLRELRQKAMEVSGLIQPNNGTMYLLDVFKFYFYKQGQKPQAIWCK